LATIRVWEAGALASGPEEGKVRLMRARTFAAALTAALMFLGGGTAAATTGAAGSGIAAAVQYQPEDTGTVPVTPPAETPRAQTPPAVTAESTAPPVTTTTPATTATTPTEPRPKPREDKPQTPSTPEGTPTTVSVAQETPATPVAESSSLPFTGFDLVPIAIAGLALLALGAALRHHARRDRS
jgi:hypothetical protein